LECPCGADTTLAHCESVRRNISAHPTVFKRVGKEDSFKQQSIDWGALSEPLCAQLLEIAVGKEQIAMLRNRGLVGVFCAALAATFFCVVPLFAQNDRIITYNPPGAGSTAGLGTQPPGINQAGAITGFYSDSNNVMHGFLRAPNGAIIPFDAPGAGTETVGGLHGTPGGVPGGQGTYSIAINLEWAIVGFYYDDSNLAHGFLRTPDGRFITIDDPNAGTDFRQGTFALNMNALGVIAGSYWDTGYNSHGFVRIPNGTFTNFDAPGAGTGPGQGTRVMLASCINLAGEVTGYYIDAQGVANGFVRSPNGYIAEFDAPGAGTAAGQGTFSWSITPEGAVTGEYIDSDNVGHGFVRAPGGRITEFDVPGAGTAAGEGSIPEAIDPTGTVTGTYIDKNGVNHGFVRSPIGRFSFFDAPWAGKGAGQGTVPFTSNPAGEITGIYFDHNNVLHGFVRLPDAGW
jgi:hypothetical protein